MFIFVHSSMYPQKWTNKLILLSTPQPLENNPKSFESRRYQTNVSHVSLLLSASPNGHNCTETSNYRSRHFTKSWTVSSVTDSLTKSVATEYMLTKLRNVICTSRYGCVNDSIMQLWPPIFYMK